MSGFFNVSRDIFDHPVFGDDSLTRREAWLWLIAKAAWQPLRIHVRNGRSVGTITLQRGQLSHSRSYMKRAWRWTSEKKVRTFLARLERDGMVTLQTGQLQNVICICNYDAFQLRPAVEGQRPDHQTGQQRAVNRPEVKTLEYLRNENTRSRAGESDQFDRWYAVYPKKVEKIAAQKSFDRLIATGKIPFEDLMAVTIRFAASVAGKDKQYIKGPAVWLNKGCYLDEPDAPAQTPGGAIAAPTRDPTTFRDDEWRTFLRGWTDSGDWSVSYWGPKPGQPGCLVPARLLLNSAPDRNKNGAAS
jgi:hypothetical protein